MGITNIYNGIVQEASSNGSVDIAVGENTVIKARQHQSLNTGDKVRVCIRPQDIKIVRENEAIKPELSENIFGGVIESECLYGDMCGLRFKVELQKIFAINSSSTPKNYL